MLEILGVVIRIECSWAIVMPNLAKQEETRFIEEQLKWGQS